MTRYLTTFTFGCTIGAASYAIGAAGYQPGVIGILTVMWLSVMACNTAAFAFLCLRTA